MSRTLREINLSTRAARDRLKPSGKPYYRALDNGLHLGYRKGRRGAVWVARWYVGAEAYKVQSLDGRRQRRIRLTGPKPSFCQSSAILMRAGCRLRGFGDGMKTWRSHRPDYGARRKRSRKERRRAGRWTRLTKKLCAGAARLRTAP